MFIASIKTSIGRYIIEKVSESQSINNPARHIGDICMYLKIYRYVNEEILLSISNCEIIKEIEILCLSVLHCYRLNKLI